MIAIALLLAAAPLDPCWDMLPGPSADACAKLAFERADAALNREWKAVRQRMRGSDDEKDLLRAQRAWLSFRDANCWFDSHRARGGTHETRHILMCKAEMTQRRAQELHEQNEPN